MSVHRTHFSEQTIEVVAVHPSAEQPGHVRLEVFTDDDVERLREVDVILDPEQARALAAGLIRHAELADRPWAQALTDGDACPTCGARGDEPCTTPLGYTLPGPHTTRPTTEETDR